MQQPSRRRFIAGAVCPRCSAMDKIAVDPDEDVRFCVSCGFREARPANAPSGTQELGTRVNRAAARRVETPAEPVRLMTPGNGKRR